MIWTILAIIVAVWMIMGKLDAMHETLRDIHERDDEEGGVDLYSEDDEVPVAIEPLSKLSKSR